MTVTGFLSVKVTWMTLVLSPVPESVSVPVSYLEEAIVTEHHVAFHGAQIGPALDCVAEEVVLHRVVVEVGDDLAGVDRLRARDGR